ncbi:MAG: hypothetical protein AAF614_38215 [Chloroflexota bacterium]
MAKAYQLEISSEQNAELTKVVRKHPKPYVRERASGILKVAAGNALRQVAYYQLLRRHAPETVVWDSQTSLELHSQP